MWGEGVDGDRAKKGEKGGGEKRTENNGEKVWCCRVYKVDRDALADDKEKQGKIEKGKAVRLSREEKNE